MSHLLPALGHPARDMFDVSALVDVAEGRQPVHCQRFAVRKMAERSLAEMPAAKRLVYFFVEASTDELQLVSVGRRGGFKVEWRFGHIGKRAKLA